MKTKVHILWEGHTILRNLHLTFDYSTQSKIRWRFLIILRPSQNIWTFTQNKNIWASLWICSVLQVVFYKTVIIVSVWLNTPNLRQWVRQFYRKTWILEIGGPDFPSLFVMLEVHFNNENFKVVWKVVFSWNL